MQPELEKLLEDTKQRLFHSDEFRVSRDLIRRTQGNAGQTEELDVLLERIDRFAPAMKQWADSLDVIQYHNNQ
jgi:hypothetical protein